MLGHRPVYRFIRGQPGLFVEIYFPKRVELQGTIFGALEKGHDEDVVRHFLRRDAKDLLTELADYPGLLDPYQYDVVGKPTFPESALTRARKRIAMYASVFYGWSMYEVDGVFFNGGEFTQERTQVIRLMFRFRSQYTGEAEVSRCTDVLRSILMFAVAVRGELVEETAWNKAAQRRFMARHEPWSDSAKKHFAERHFTDIAQGAIKWVDDCALFTFGYLVKRFSEQVLKVESPEDEIWVTSFSDLTLNVIGLAGRSRS
ncbi:MAG: hypothetical protein ACYDH9_14105 [Limisphaerales bacterium]